jgi:hypothetical protein
MTLFSSQARRPILALLGFIVFVAASRALAAESSLAEKPFMGWSSWSFFRGKPTEARIKAEADAMAAKLKPFGYVYINIDSGWSDEFDEYGRDKADSSRFPSGIAALAEYVHRKGLKLEGYFRRDPEWKHHGKGEPDRLHEAWRGGIRAELRRSRRRLGSRFHQDGFCGAGRGKGAGG